MVGLSGAPTVGAEGTSRPGGTSETGIWAYEKKRKKNKILEKKTKKDKIAYRPSCLYSFAIYIYMQKVAFYFQFKC